MGKRWIVLVNKTPRGPLSLQEIEALLEQNLVRRNDLAYEVPFETPSEEKLIKPAGAPAEWKFLWQFSDFDRRKEEALPEDNAQLSEAQKNRRVAPTQSQLKQEVIAALPAEFAHIQPEELVLRTRQNQRDEFTAVETFSNSGNETSEEMLPPRQGSTNSWWVLSGAVCALFVVVLVWRGKSDSKPDSTIANLQLPALRAPADISPPLPPSRGTEAPPHPVVVIPVKAPPVQTPDKGEVSLEDYRKLRDERLDKERLEEEERLKAEQKAWEEENQALNEEGEDGEPPPKSSRVKKSRRRKAIAEEEEPLEREPTESSKSEKLEEEY